MSIQLALSSRSFKNSVSALNQEYYYLEILSQLSAMSGESVFWLQKSSPQFCSSFFFKKVTKKDVCSDL